MQEECSRHGLVVQGKVAVFANLPTCRLFDLLGSWRVGGVRAGGGGMRCERYGSSGERIQGGYRCRRAQQGVGGLAALGGVLPRCWVVGG